jgi:thioredoxin 1
MLRLTLRLALFLLATTSFAQNQVKTLSTQEFKNKVFDYAPMLKDGSKPIMKNDKPTIIDYYADWCAPCKTSAPIFDKLAAKYGKQINFYRVDVDRDSEPYMITGSQGIPLFLFIFPDGSMSKVEGLMPNMEKEFSSIIETSMLK